ncbi:unnamed protein product [Rotaria sp. Silwood1]|nr:unnamed protein product [Rotaria sp. Silwood1]CAF1650684.1 unnamed protein product [Rotaria sp. Silwood1]
MATDPNYQTSTTTPEIDERLYSRQLYVIGKEAMYELRNADILISGMRGLGVEIAKNLILCGVKSVIVHDCNNVDYKDLSSQYYFSEFDIGQNRAEVTKEKLSELNNNVNVTYSSSNIDEDFLQKHKVNVFVLTDDDIDNQVKIGDYCHEHGIKFVNANIKGLFGQIFCDFDQNFKVFDTNGEDSITEEIVDSISHDEIGVVSIATYTKHGFEDGSYVTFHGVKGMTEINDHEFKITVLDPYTFIIGDTRNFGVYEGEGTVTEVKKAETVHFMSMSANLHLSFQGLSLFQNQYNALPQPWNDDDADKFYEIVEKLNRENREQVLTDQLNKHWIRLFAKTCTGDLCPIQSVIGGIAAQEAVKAVTGKFMPIRQFLYFDAIECLSENVFYLSNEGTSESNTRSNFPSKQSRYYFQEIVFGEDLQDKLGNAKYFLVGSGAIGCEILKNFAMMGIGCGRDGAVFVSDMDSIKISDLHRQFLFHYRDIGVNSGIFGTKASVQVVVPFLTESYSSTNDPPDPIVDLSTAIHFPISINHIIQWAIYTFSDLFTIPAQQVEEFVRDPKGFAERTAKKSSEYEKNGIVENVKRILVEHRPRNFTDCIKWSRNLFEQQFHNAIVQLLHNFPRDRVTDRGELFWSGYRRCPHLLKFDVNNKLHLDFIIAASNLFAHMYNNPQTCDRQFIAQEVTKVQVPEFKPKSIFTADNDSNQWRVDDQQRKNVQEENNSSIEQLLNRLPKLDEIVDIKIQPHELKTDDDTNFHMDYTVATTLLRAENYEIQITDRSQIKRIAENIIPAIVTTTAMVTGLVCLEVYKLIQGHKKIESYRNACLNLALPFFAFFEPIPPKYQKA